MADRHDIREHMEVVGSDGLHIGTVDHVDGDRIKLTRKDSPDGAHHYVPLSNVVRTDGKVHLATTAASMGLGAVAGQTGYKADDGSAPFPPIANLQAHGKPRGNFYLPWVVGLVGLLLLVLLFRSCTAEEMSPSVDPTLGDQPATATAALPVEAVALPNGRTVQLAPNSFNFELQRFLASGDAVPRTFVFDRLNFDTGASRIRAEDQPTVDALGDILAAYPNARGRIVGYTDAQGGAGANASLGLQRANEVVAALAAKGVSGRFEAASGGEANPADTNATGAGRFENRRTELVVTAK